ncbi:thioesterase family protein [Bradyrhizobium sp. CAR08]
MADWIGYDGHVSESRYFELVGDASETLLRSIGIDDEYRSTHGDYQIIETHMSHHRELRPGDSAEVLTQVLGADERNLHLFHAITSEGDEEPAATSEQMLLHVAAANGRSGPVQGKVRDCVLELARLHADLPQPERTSANIGLR